MSGVDFLLLSGSPRGKVSTSNNLLIYLQTHLELRGKSTKLEMVHKITRNEEDFGNFTSQLDNSEYLILAAPLYVDSLPSHVMDIFERLSKERNIGNTRSKPKFVALVNNGFPEHHQNQLALQICRQFAQEANLEWIGGIPIGGGAMLSGTSLENAGGRGRHVRPALEILAEALSNGDSIPEESIVTVKKSVIPKRLYLMIAHSGWKKMAESNQVQDRIKDQPYLT